MSSPACNRASSGAIVSRSLCSCRAINGAPMPKCANSGLLWRVSSAATSATSRNTRCARGEKSSRLPIGVATIHKVPAISLLSRPLTDFMPSRCCAWAIIVEIAREDSTMRGIRIPAARLTCAWLCAAALLAGCASLGQLASHPSPEAPTQSLPPGQQAQLLAEHARAQEANGDPFGAAHTWAQLAPLVSPMARADNDKQIRRLLMSLDPDQLKSDYDTLADSDPLKPYARAVLAQLGVAVPRALPQLDHPVGTEMGQGNAITREGYQMPARVALLLPASGPLATPAEAVREGFFSAYFGNPSDAPRPQVRSYDSGGTPAQSQQAYNQAVADGEIGR